jgi:hypothetical protein
MIRGTQIRDKTFSSTETKQGRLWAVIRLARDRLGKRPSKGKFSTSPKARYKVLDAESFPTRPTLTSDAALPLARSRPPVMSPTFLRRQIEQAKRRQGPNHDAVAHNHMGKSC